MNNKAILLVEDNPDHEALMLRALKRSNLSNEVIVARDGAEQSITCWATVTCHSRSFCWA